MGAVHEGTATFGTLWAQSEPAETDGKAWPKVPVRMAIDRLKSLIRLHAEGGPPRAKTSIRKLG